MLINEFWIFYCSFSCLDSISTRFWTTAPSFPLSPLKAGIFSFYNFKILISNDITILHICIIKKNSLTLFELVCIYYYSPSQIKVSLRLHFWTCHFPSASILTQFFPLLFPIGPDCPLQLLHERGVSFSAYLKLPSFTLSVMPNQEVSFCKNI